MQVLKTFEDESVNCCVTSPPYYGLRDYGCDGQIGLEDAPEQYIAKLVDVFHEVRRVLHDDGTLWLNIGDSYAGSGKGQTQDGCADPKNAKTIGMSLPTPKIGIPAKNLIGIPWMLAFALRADGWYLRQDIIWAKPNPMPESVTDRCTKSHEYIFLLSKSAKYYYDAEAIAEPSVCKAGTAGTWDGNRDYGLPNGATRFGKPNLGGSADGTRNKRDVWMVSTQPYSEAHFATFPPKLIEPCILAGCPEGGVVLDPFFGSGTTGEVATYLGRDYIGIELNPKYIEIAERRTQQIGFAQMEV